MPQGPDRLPGLHALRLIAAFGVFVLHCSIGTLSHEPLLNYASAHFFALGVPLFYVVSAFSLMHSTRVYTGEERWVTKFYSKRFWRIAPLFYVMCVVSSFYIWTEHARVPSLLEIGANLIFAVNLSPQYAWSLTMGGWSVGVEMLFYLVFPLLFLGVRTLRAAAAFLIVSLVVGHFAYAPLSKYPMLVGNYADFAFITFLPCFALGLAAYLLYQRIRDSVWGAADAPLWRVATYHAFFAFTSLAMTLWLISWNRWLWEQARADIAATSVLFAWVCVWLTARPAIFLNWSPIQFLGERSYSLYLLHPLVLIPVAGFGPVIYSGLHPYIGGWAMLVALIVLYIPVVVVSAVTYALIERPGMNVGRALDARPKAKPPRVAPEAA